MGSFNVACSISNLSISSGTKVGFIPLLPKNYLFRKSHSPERLRVMEPTNSLIYPNCYLNPFSLPIFGEYNDYGSLEEIEEDANTKQIEAFFGISIQQFVSILSESRGITDYFGNLFDSYSLYKTLFDSHAVGFDQTFLETLGFIMIKDEDEELFQFENFPVFVQLTEGTSKGYGAGMGFTLVDKDYNLLFSNDGYEAAKELVKAFDKETGYLLNVAKENQIRVKMIQDFSGMFVHRAIYEELVQFDAENQSLADEYLNETNLRSFGFYETIKDKTGDSFFAKEGFPYQVWLDGYSTKIQHETDKNDVYRYVSSVRVFAENWQQATGESLDITHFLNTSKFDLLYDAYQASIFEAEKEKAVRVEALEKMLETSDEIKRDQIKEIISLSSSMTVKPNDFSAHFRDWDYFEELYLEPIKNGQLKQEFIDFIYFYSSMYSCNRFFFPAMNGEQSGNLEASKILLEKSLEIVNKEIKERDE